MFIGLIILVIYLIILAKNLVTTVKSTNKILQDAEVVTDVAQKRTTDVDGLLDDVISSVSGISGALKGEENKVQSLSSIAKAITSVIGMIEIRNKIAMI